MTILDRPVPVIAAPMAGASTPALAAAVTEAGGLGFLAAGYLTADAMAAEVADYRAATGGPVAINLFTPQTDRSQELAGPLARHGEALLATAARYGTTPGQPRFDEDDFTAKVAWLVEHTVDLVTFTFGPVPAEVVRDLRARGTLVGFTVTSRREAQSAVALGADLLVAQGAGAGGHRGTWHVSDEPNTLTTAEVLDAVCGFDLPVIATGGVGTSADVRALLDAGAAAVAVGTLFLPADESRAGRAHRKALTSASPPRKAVITRAFSGRWARALANDFTRAHESTAVSAYPNLHHMSRPIRAAAAEHDDPEGLALWAGAGHRWVRSGPAAGILAQLTPTAG